MLHRNHSPKRMMPYINRPDSKACEVNSGLRLKNMRTGDNNAVGIVRLETQ